MDKSRNFSTVITFGESRVCSPKESVGNNSLERKRSSFTAFMKKMRKEKPDNKFESS